MGRPRRMWEDNIKLDLREIGIDGANWIQLAQVGSSAGFCEQGGEPSNSIKKSGYFFDKLSDNQFSQMFSAIE
jgi:hypothetical protein